MTVDKPHIKVRDVRGLAIEAGCHVVAVDQTSTGTALLHEYVVRAVSTQRPPDLARIYVEGEAGYYTPNQVAVVPALSPAAPREPEPERPEEEEVKHIPWVEPFGGGVRRYVARCPCGFRSEPYDKKPDAQRAGLGHYKTKLEEALKP